MNEETAMIAVDKGVHAAFKVEVAKRGGTLKDRAGEALRQWINDVTKRDRKGVKYAN